MYVIVVVDVVVDVDVVVVVDVVDGVAVVGLPWFASEFCFNKNNTLFILLELYAFGCCCLEDGSSASEVMTLLNNNKPSAQVI